ncbi:hypothetical protein ACNT8L_04475 [Brucella intermedia]|uniref:hypothetical protein n=1 Tax=Brucella intermedia TaxID=94625 RepID=UPI003AB65CA8
MAYQDQFYTTGTVTVTSGSPTVTGAGTGWQTALIQGGVLYVRGGAYPILTVDGETKITLAVPYTGTNGSGVLYAVDRQRSAATSAVAMNDRLAQIIASIETAQPASEILAGLAALQPANNQLIYATGPKTFNLSPLTPFARSLLDDNDAATMLGTLGLTNDALHSKSLDSFGSYWPSTVPIDILSLPAGSSGLATATGHTNLPPTTPGVNFWYLEVQRTYSDNRRRIIATGVPGNAPSTVPAQYIISNDASGNWTPWRLLTVLEGSNSNGSYIRFPDGTQICYRAGVTTSSTWTATGSVFKSGATNWTYPAAFNEAPLVLAGTNADNAWYGASNGTTTAGGVSFFLPFAYSGTLVARLAAIGRWF